MNRCYRVLWNSATGTWVVTCDLARAPGKRSGGPRPRALALLLGAALLGAGGHAAAQQRSHWDGDGAGNAGNGQVDGGSGTWTATSTNWTGADGASNGARSPLPGAPVFQGTGGTVAVDNGQGAIDVAGMSFNADGYRLQGGSVGLADPQSLFRVGGGYTATLATALTGSGGLVKGDAGTLALFGANSYAGGTTIQQGTVAIGGAVGANGQSSVFGSGLVRMAGGTALHYDVSGGFVNYRLNNALALDGNIQVRALGGNGGGVTFTGPVSLGDGRRSIDAGNGRIAFNGVVSGNGGLDIIGGTVEFGGQAAMDNTYTGSVTVHSGAVGDFGRAGSVVVTGDLLVRSGGQAIADTLYATPGPFFQSPPSRIFGAHSTVTIEAGGQLTIGTGGPVIPNLRGDGLVVLNDRRPIAGAGFVVESGDFSGSIVGRGGVVKRGAGTLILRGRNTYSSAFFNDDLRIEEGTVLVEGSVSSGVLARGAGSLIGGNGRVGNLTVAGGAAVAPGSGPGSIGTLTVDLRLGFAPEGRYIVDIDASGRSDLLYLGYLATLDGTLQVEKAANQRYRPGTRYTIVTAVAGVSGQFHTLIQNSPFINLALSYDPKNVYLDVLRSAIAFPDVGVTANQIAAATATEALGEGHAVYDAVLGLDEAQARDAFEQLSGEVHASLQSALLDDSRFVRDAYNARLRDPAGEGRVLWAQAYGSWGGYDGDGNARRVDRSLGGVLLGADTDLDGGWRLGLGGGAGRTQLSTPQRHARADAGSYHLGAYAGWRNGGFGLRFGAAYSRHDVDSDRRVRFPDYADRLSARYDASTAQVYAEAGYAFERGALALEPYLNTAWVRVRNEGYAERGGDAALRVRSGDAEAGYATLGLRLGTDLGPQHAPLRFRAGLGWRHAFGDGAARTAMAYASGSPDFAVQGVPLAGDAAVLEAGIAGPLGERVTLGVGYQGLIGDDLDDHGLRGELSWRF